MICWTRDQDQDRMAKKVWETTRRMREKTETKWVIELRKEWTEMWIKVEEENWGKKIHQPKY